MIEKRYSTVKKRIIKSSFYLVLLLMIIFLFASNTIAQETQSENNSNRITIESKRADYDNHLLYANIHIQLYIDANTESLYLILPIKDNPGVNTIIEPQDENRTVLSGFLGENDYFLIEFLPYSQGSEISLWINNVQLSIYESTNGESFGYYELCFNKTTENIPAFINNNTIGINEIRIVDKNIFSSIPDTQHEGTDTLLFNSDNEHILVNISKEQTIDVPRIGILIFLIICGYVDILFIKENNPIVSFCERKRKYRVVFIILSVIVFLVVIGLYPGYIMRHNYQYDTTILGFYAALFVETSIFVGNIIRICIGIKKQDEPIPDQGKENPL